MLMERISLWVCIIVLVLIPNIQGQNTSNSSLTCSKSEILCGKNICYDPTIQNCTKTEIVQCLNKCGYYCYNSELQQCLNGTICGINDGLCAVKYTSFGYTYGQPIHQCYNRSHQVCLNNSLCLYPSETCNQQCLRYNQVCVDNTTICNVTGRGSRYLPGQIKLCNGVCYDSTIRNCVGGSVQCIDGTCSDRCYNSSSKQCLNGTICNLGEQICAVKYDILGNTHASLHYECYNSSHEVCINYTSCDSSRLCNQQCLLYNQVCVDNNKICNVTDWYDDYEPNQIKLCNGTCYDSAIKQCVNDSVQCITGNCSGICYNSSLQQCLNGKLCNLNEKSCTIRYNSYGLYYSSPVYQCYNPSNQTCMNNTLCDNPSQTCNQQCLRYNEACFNNVTICHITGTYDGNKAHQIKLCNNVCYNSTIEECVDEYKVRCIKEPYSQNCTGSSGKNEPPFILLISVLIVICSVLNF